jgi:NitT/TauT family transport system substrate-binding protein
MRALTRRSLLASGAAAMMIPGAALAQATTLKMAGVPEDSATTVLYGIQSGLFRSHGLNVDLQTQHNGPSVMSGVAGNSYQMGKSSTPPLIVAVSRGLPFVMIAPAGLYVSTAPIAALLVKNDATVTKASDLNGKTVATGALNDVHSLAVRSWMDKNGGDSTAVKFVEIPISEIPVSIAQGRVDAGSVNEPVLSAGLATAGLKVFARHFDAIAPRFMYTAWFTTKQFDAANAPAVKSFATLLKQAAQYCNTHHAETIDMIAKYTSLELSTVQKMTRVEQGTSLDPKLLQPVVDAMVKYKYLAQPIDVRAVIAPGLT